MTMVLLVLLLTGLSAAAAGQSLRAKQVSAEHWLWKKQRLRRARVLSTSGSVVSALSGVLLVLGLMGLTV